MLKYNASYKRNTNGMYNGCIIATFSDGRRMFVRILDDLRKNKEDAIIDAKKIVDIANRL